jgi:hydrogenase maturation protease
MVSARTAARRLLIGIGNPQRGDDGIGCTVALRLLARKDCTRHVRVANGEATSLMTAWNGFDDVVLVDACRGAGAPGSVHRLASDELERLESLRHASTHSLGVAAALGLSRALGCAPARLVVYAVEGLRFENGAPLTPEAERGIAEVVALVVQEKEGEGTREDAP